MEGSLIYRDTKDYIRRGLDNVGGMDFGFYENHGRAKTKGYNVSLRYSYANWFSLGGTFNSMDAIDREKRLAEGTGQASLTYGQRIPNQPYRYANFPVLGRLRRPGYQSTRPRTVLPQPHAELQCGQGALQLFARMP